MIKKLQKRFIIIAMISVISVLTVIMVAVNINNYSKTSKYADTVLDFLVENGGQFPQQESPRPISNPSINNRITDETPYETRYFTIKYDKNGNIVDVDTIKIFKVNNEKAVEYANLVLNKKSKIGYEDEYRYKVSESDEGTMVVFVDCTRELMNVNVFLRSSIIIGCIGILGVFIIVLLLSKKAIAPIAKSYEKQKHFITDASHELKTPLTIISANNELTELEVGKSDNTSSITKQVAKMNSMVKNLTMLSKIDEKNVLQEKQKFDFSDAIFDVVNMFIKTADSKGKKMIINIEDKIDFVGDEKLIRQFASILIDNAIKYSFSKININLSKIKNHIELMVINDTEGIEKGNLDKYFDRFYRSDEMRASEIEGSGIGLSIAKEIIDLHKGKINAFSDDAINFNVKIIL